jgi:hypothetical protein
MFVSNPTLKDEESNPFRIIQYSGCVFLKKAVSTGCHVGQKELFPFLICSVSILVDTASSVLAPLKAG